MLSYGKQSSQLSSRRAPGTSAIMKPARRVQSGVAADVIEHALSEEGGKLNQLTLDSGAGISSAGIVGHYGR